MPTTLPQLAPLTRRQAEERELALAYIAIADSVLDVVSRLRDRVRKVFGAH